MRRARPRARAHRPRSDRRRDHACRRSRGIRRSRLRACDGSAEAEKFDWRGRRWSERHIGGGEVGEVTNLAGVVNPFDDARNGGRGEREQRRAERRCRGEIAAVARTDRRGGLAQDRGEHFLHVVLPLLPAVRERARKALAPGAASDRARACVVDDRRGASRHGDCGRPSRQRRRPPGRGDERMPSKRSPGERDEIDISRVRFGRDAPEWGLNLVARASSAGLTESIIAPLPSARAKCSASLRVLIPRFLIGLVPLPARRRRRRTGAAHA